MPIQFHAAPGPRGEGHGRSASDAADYLDHDAPGGFWQGAVRRALDEDGVSVNLLPGDYARGPLILSGLGREGRPLIIQGDPRGATVLRISPGPGTPKATFFVKSCRNLVIRSLTFTGDGVVPYVSQVSDGSRDVTLEDCTWRDLPNFVYGATGAAGSTTQDVTYKRCTFREVGTSGGAHMMYHSNGCRRIRVIDCTFEDCSGDYVRFRNQVDHCVVSGCSFRSSGVYPPGAPASLPFIAMPLFNDCEPGGANCPDPDAHIQYEYFATNYLFADNIFAYESHPGRGSRTAIGFSHRGYDPPRRRHLLTREEGEVLRSGDAAQRRALLLSHCGIDMGKVHVYGNTYRGVDTRFGFASSAQYGAASRGWDGSAEIIDLARAAPSP